MVRVEAEELGAALAGVFAQNPVAGGRSWLWRPLLGLLAEGEPVGVERLSEAAGRPAGEVAEAIAAVPGIEVDEDGRVLGYGLTLRPTPHRFELDGTALYTWCALDTLVFPVLLGRAAQVESPCHATGVPVRVEVTPDGVASVEPPEAVVSIVTPEDVSDVRPAFCNQVHFFASRQAAAGWLDQHSGGAVVTVREAFELGCANPDLLSGGGDSACC